MKPLELHPLCALFPRLAPVDFDVLRTDIAAHGLRQPIVTFDGMILDGGNRYRACIEAGIEPVTMPLGDDDPLAYVLSANLRRRHLSPGQQATIVAAASDWQKAHPRGGNGSNQHRQKEQMRNVAHLLTAKQRAAQSGASVRTQQSADRIAKVSPALAQKVAHGEISLPQAVATVMHNAAASSPSQQKSRSNSRPPARPKKGRKADAMRNELAEAAARGVSMLCTYARLTLSAIQAQSEFSPEESVLLAQIACAIRQREIGVSEHEN
ncbi:ParB/RepB/Spo0J family partition protein [Paraburkholderia caffeinilytica]|uniref:ParB/RepB/Spo0J family partition protein n=1 Tax=Paraburkholderia caffeinilytica TaxID=1761016 RepID=UPI003DA198A3